MVSKMMPGETPYTPEEVEQLNDLVSQAADQDPGEDFGPFRSRLNQRRKLWKPSTRH